MTSLYIWVHVIPIIYHAIYMYIYIVQQGLSATLQIQEQQMY